MSTLNRTYPVAENLFSLYEYMNYLLIQTNIKKDVRHGEEVLGYLQELRETWAVASKQAQGTLLNE